MANGTISQLVFGRLVSWVVSLMVVLKVVQVLNLVGFMRFYKIHFRGTIRCSQSKVLEVLRDSCTC